MKAVLNVETYLHCSQDSIGTQHGLWPGGPGLSPSLHLSDYGRVARNTSRTRLVVSRGDYQRLLGYNAATHGPRSRHKTWPVRNPFAARFGGHGRGVSGTHARLGRDVAIKILAREMSADPARKQRFEREAKTISGLNHPHICVLHDVGSQDGMELLVMECVEGERRAKPRDKGATALEQV